MEPCASQRVYACVNPGSKHPRAANKDSAGGLVSQLDTFGVRNGQTTGSLTVNPPGAPTFQPDCSPPMTVVLVSVCYNEITISGEGASVDLGSHCNTLRPDPAKRHQIQSGTRPRDCSLRPGHPSGPRDGP
jgi:hypothetical protein